MIETEVPPVADTLLLICCLSLTAALCRQLLSQSRGFPAVRMALGIQAALALLRQLARLFQSLPGIN